MSYKHLKSFPNYQISHLGKVKNTKTGKIVKGSLNENNYRRVTLYNNGRSKAFYVHRLVAFLFIPNPNNYSDTHHLNGKRDDNRSSNLIWCSHYDNIQYKYVPHKVDYKWKNPKPPNNNFEQELQFINHTVKILGNDPF